MTLSHSIEDRIQRSRNTKEYQNYHRVRESVIKMIEESSVKGSSTSDYWKEELQGFEYMLDASPLIIESLREHCYHITGLKSYDYRSHHSHKKQPYIEKLNLLKNLDGRNLCIPENRNLGGFGHEIDGELYNLDTLKFYEQLIAMDIGGVLPLLEKNDGKRNFVVEIGSGWGGFGYQIKKHFPNVTYVCVDLPQTMLFSAVYLSSLFPDSNTLIYGDIADEQLLDKWYDYDFIFLPHYKFADLELPNIDVAINTVSFQEMTTEQVSGYASKLKENGCRCLYSHNRDRSPHNQQLTKVSDILSLYFKTSQIDFLDTSYTTIGKEKKRSLLNDTVRALRKQLPGRLNRKAQDKSNRKYRHIVGR